MRLEIVALAQMFQDDFAHIVIDRRQVNLGVTGFQQADLHTLAHIDETQYLRPEQTFALDLKPHAERGFQGTLQGFEGDTGPSPGSRKRHKAKTAFINDETHG